MKTYEVTTRGSRKPRYQVSKVSVESGHLILRDGSGFVIAAFAPDGWIACELVTE